MTVYEVYALKYAERDAWRPDVFVGGDPHDAPMPMDYFIWLTAVKGLEGIAVRLDVDPSK